MPARQAGDTGKVEPQPSSGKGTQVGTPFTFVATLKIDPDRMPEYLSALRDVLGPARNEPTNVFLYPHCTEEPGTIVLFERWLDSDAFVNEVLQTEHYRRYLSIVEPLYVASREVRFLTPID
jgi:quinol monooxygenase YgiN